jgi:triosephosphate isomerase
MRKPLVAGNWKMNGNHRSNIELLGGIVAGAGDVKVAEMAVCPPAVYLAQVADALRGTDIVWGAQNLSEYAPGAYTGEIAAEMLVDFECRYVILGHSERRHVFGEKDAVVAKKFVMAQQHGLRPILCVGELLEERESGHTEAVVARQLDVVLELAGVVALKEAVIAYEPVWAIGTGKTASPEQAQQVHRFIRQRIAEENEAVAENVQILYGGSVKGSNAAELFAMADIDGGLIGGAALQAEEFLAIAKAAG